MKIVLSFILLIALAGCQQTTLDKKFDSKTAKQDLAKLEESGEITKLEQEFFFLKTLRYDSLETMTYGEIIAKVRADEAEREKLKKEEKKLMVDSEKIASGTFDKSDEGVVGLMFTLDNTTPYVIAGYDFEWFALSEGDTLSKGSFNGNKSLAPGDKRESLMEFEGKFFEETGAEIEKAEKAGTLEIMVKAKDLSLGMPKK